MRSSPGGGFSSPQLKKYVTWAYFSVSASRRLVRPCAASTSARLPEKVWGGKTTGSPNAASYSVSVSTRRAGGDRRSKPSKSAKARARVSCRARSARKLKKTTASPSRSRPTGRSSAVVTTHGSTNSSLTPRA